MQQEQGFLSPDSQAEILEFRRRYAPMTGLLDRANRMAMKVLNAISFHSKDTQRLCVAILFSKTVQSLQASIVLVERGMAADARTALRSATEAAIFLAKIVSDATFIDVLEEHDDLHHKKLANALLQDPFARKSMSPEVAADYQKIVATIAAKYGQRELTPLNTQAVAQSVNLLAFYNTIFRPTSGDSAHPSLTSMGRHARADGDGNLRLIFGTQDDDAEHTMFGISTVFLDVMMRTVNVFEFLQYEAAILELHADIRQTGGLSPTRVVE